MGIKYSVPIIMTEDKKELTAQIKLMKEAGVERIFLVFDRDVLYTYKQERYDILKENIDFCKKSGLETGVWISTFGFGNARVNGKDKVPIAPYTPIKSVDGIEMVEAFCPTSKEFTSICCEYVKNIAKLSPDVILLDDEMCLSVRPGLGCVCDNHLNLISSRYGKTVKREDIIKAFSGKPNKLRNIFIDVMGDTVKEFCKSVRNAIDSVDKNIRCGYCAGYTSYDVEGAFPQEITRILAGDTKPILRLSGAPYWGSRKRQRFPGQEIGTVCEFIRSQIEYLNGEFEDLMTEEDSYPRPRYVIGSSYVELCDLAIIANGGANALKYMSDYVSTSSYETGYYKHHNKNRELREFLYKDFSSLKPTGIYVYNKFDKSKEAVLPEFDGNHDAQVYIMSMCFNRASTMLSKISVPTTYKSEDSDVAICFGQNALAIDKLPKKLILDFEAVRILTGKGFDLGVKKFESVSVPTVEKYKGEKILLFNQGGKYYKCELNGKAEIISTFDNGEICCYKYESEDCEFLVYTFDAQTLQEGASVFYTYSRQEQILDFVGQMPSILKSPSVYTIAKKDKNTLALFYENIYEDPIFDAEINLGDNYKIEKIMGANGEIKGNKLKIDYIAPYSPVAVLLKK